ncbi:MAG: ABC transporter permease [Fibrobacteres bacterium]|nr:ABC transporter permease [Fibrobacterota bacterium]
MTANSDAFRKLRRNRAALAALIFILFVIAAAISAPLLENHLFPSPDAQNLSDKLLAPSFDHPFGTDSLGRDLLSRVFAGARISIMVGFIATLITIMIGVTYGAVSGFSGGNVDNIMMRVVDALYTLPFIFLVILLLGLFDRSFLLLFAALGAVQWLTMARMVRGEILSLKTRDFVAAARASGASPSRILFRHLLPNTLGVIIVYATLTVPVIILQEAFLSFLGLTVPGQEHSWGALISEGLDAVNPVKIRWWLVVFPGAAISSTLLALNFLGDGLRDAFDPKSR